MREEKKRNGPDSEKERNNHVHLGAMNTVPGLIMSGQLMYSIAGFSNLGLGTHMGSTKWFKYIR